MLKRLALAVPLTLSIACAPATRQGAATADGASTGASARQAGAAAGPTSLATLAGRYQLVSIDGHAIPFAPVHPGRPANAPPGPQVIASTLQLRANGTFIMAMSYRMSREGVERFFDMPFSGSWQPEGAAFRMRWDDAGQTMLAMRSDTLFLDNEGIRFAYRKQ